MPNSETFKNICGTIGSCLHFCFPARATSKSRLGKLDEKLPDDDILGEVVEKLPDDVVIDILSRLAAKEALMCRRVCKKWRDLTSTQGFVILHMRRSIPMILYMVEKPDSRYVPALLENWREPAAGTRPIMHIMDRYSGYGPKSSHGGLIVMRGWSGNFMILNPVNNENVIIIVGKGPYTYQVLGVFFHPSLEEYCTLWEIRVWNTFGALERQAIYRLLNLGSNSKPCWRDIRNPWCYTSRCKRSVLVNDYIYWIVLSEDSERSYGIMAFSIRSEEITLMALPVAGLMIYDLDKTVTLLNVDGYLSLVSISLSTRLVNVTILTLENHSNWMWKSSNYSFMREVFRGFYLMRDPIAICDGELLLDASSAGILVCNLKLGTTRILWNRHHNTYAHWPHVMSLVSLRNCKPNICVDEKGEIEGNA